MKILIDECAPRALKSSLAAHGYECLTVQEAGWAGKSNGELLSLAETAFEVFVTLDTNLRYQRRTTNSGYCYGRGIESPGTTEPPFSSLR